MLNLPDWVNRFIKDKNCPHCDEKFLGCQILQIGFRIRDVEDPGSGYCLCFDARCNNCENIISTTIITDVIFNSRQIIDEIYKTMDKDDVKKKKNTLRYKQKINKTNSKNTIEYKIPDHEHEELKKFLTKNDDFESFLKFIGAPNIDYKKR